MELGYEEVCNMMTMGYAKEYHYAGDSSLMVKVRIPSIHGPYKETDARGKIVHNYVRDEDLPFYRSLLLPRYPKEGDVVVLESASGDSNSPDFIVIGLTGASYTSGSNV